MDDIQPYLQYFEQHTTLAILFVFLIAFGEALLIIGLFVPSTVVLVSAGVLVGTGHLSFWPVFAATAFGAFAGDQLSYWVGRIYGDKLKAVWPLSRYPVLFKKGEDFVIKHGGASIAIGRFVPGVKAVVPGVVGMLKMGQVYFFTVNFLSSLVWAFAHLLPGVIFGQGLAMVGDLSGRLLVVLLELLVILFVAGWLIRILVGWFSPYLGHSLQTIADWTRQRKSAAIRRWGRAISPENPRSLLLVFLFFFLLLAILGFVLITSGVLYSPATTQLDRSIALVMRSLRTEPGDELLIPLTMMGDGVVIVPVMLAIVGWLLWQRAWKVAAATAIVFIVGKTLATLLKMEVHRVRPEELYQGLATYSFPSGHTTSAALTFGVLAILGSRHMGTWARALIYAIASLLIITVAYTRVYLGVHWMTDTVGGMLFGLIIVCGFGVALEAMPKRFIRPIGLLICSSIVFLIAWGVDVGRTLPAQIAFYHPTSSLQNVTVMEWQKEAYQKLPQQRVDLAEPTGERFQVQWAGPLSRLQKLMIEKGWKVAQPWHWQDSFALLDVHKKLAQVKPSPALQEGQRAKLTMTYQPDPTSAERLVLRGYETDLLVTGPEGQGGQGGQKSQERVYVIGFARERLEKKLYTYLRPVNMPLSAEQWAILEAVLEGLPLPQVVNKPDGVLLLLAPTDH